MSGFAASAAEIALSVLAPIVMAVIILAFEAKGPLASAIHSSRGLVAPYFTAVSIIFGLFAALLVNDVWTECSIARQAVQAEADSVHLIAHLARANGIEAQVLPRLREYVSKASAEDPYSTAIDARRGDTGKAYQDLLAGFTTVYGLEPPVRPR